MEKDYMNDYQDQWTRFHHKPTDGISSSSGNGWLYSAYAKKLGLELNSFKLEECFNLCSKNGILVRNPDKTTSPFSRDEVLGATALGLLKEQHLNGWNFSPFPIPKFNLFTLLKQLWELRPTWVIGNTLLAEPIQWLSYSLSFKHRNYFWQNNLDQLYRFSFSVPLVDRHFMLKKWDKFSWTKPSHVFYWFIAKVDSLSSRRNGIRWLKYGGDKNFEAMAQEFPQDHPIYQAWRYRSERIDRIMKGLDI